MPYRLPLELELAILELAAPPLAIDSLHDRIDFFINVSLVHRSLTAWTQERLRDQFLYTYRRRSDEHERLKKRFEAGFGRDRLLRRLYLDLSRLPADIQNRREPGIDSVSNSIEDRVYEAVSDTNGSSDPAGVRTRPKRRVCGAVAHFRQFDDLASSDDYWALCDMMWKRCQSLDTLWLMPPLLKLNTADLPSLRVLYIDDSAFKSTWGSFATVPSASTTVLRMIGLHVDDASGELDARQLVFDKCWEDNAGPDEVLERCPNIETVIISETTDLNLLTTVENLPASIRHVHILHDEVDLDDVGIPYPAPDARLVLSRLESFTFTLLPDKEDPGTAEDDAEALADLKQAVSLLIDAPRCRFRYLRSTKSPEDELADAMADFGL